MSVTVSSTAINNLTVPSNTGTLLDTSNTTFFGADEWRLTTTITGTNADITSNLERSDHSGAGYLGTGMTESSGIFTFPNTGIWLVTVKNSTLFTAGDANAVVELNLTIDNSSYTEVAAAQNGQESSGTARQQAVGFAIIDVTDVSLVKVKFATSSLGSGTSVEGSTSMNLTSFKFIRLGDT